MNSTVTDDKPRLLWANVLMFVLTMAGAVIVVPWYGFAYGYSGAAWVWFAVLLYANGLAITGGYHRLWSHRTYDAHWSVRLIYMLLGAMALQNSVLVWASGHRSHHQFVDDADRDPYSASRGLWYSHIGWMLAAIRAEKRISAMSVTCRKIRWWHFSTAITTCSRSALTSWCRSRSAGCTATCGACSCSQACSASS